MLDCNHNEKFKENLNIRSMEYFNSTSKPESKYIIDITWNNFIRALMRFVFL